MDSYEKIYPTIEELSKVNKNLNCPECSGIFNSDSNLNLHLAKTHKKSHLLQQTNVNKIYHCPIVSCNYNNSTHFKQLKFLKQHYLKVHSAKNYICSLCKKGFPTESFRNSHAEYCNIIFKCCDCEMFYSCYETLKTHSRRKKHNILGKAAYKTSTNIVLKTSKSDMSLCTNKIRMLLPKPSSSTSMIVLSNTTEQGSQTDVENAQWNTQQTQTVSTTKMPQFAVETQTIGDYYIKKPESMNNTLKSTKTQTSVLNAKTVSSNTSFILEDFGLNVSDVQRNSSSTQTTVYNESEYFYSSSTSTHDSIHTDTSDLLADTLDSNFFNCNMETQTDFMFNDDLLKYCDDYSNMYTQTCEELLLGEIELNDMHTQTVFPNLHNVLKSVESQTIMSQSKEIPLSCKDMSHMETQTDMHYKQMLEEINA